MYILEDDEGKEGRREGGRKEKGKKEERDTLEAVDS